MQFIYCYECNIEKGNASTLSEEERPSEVELFLRQGGPINRPNVGSRKYHDKHGITGDDGEGDIPRHNPKGKRTPRKRGRKGDIGKGDKANGNANGLEVTTPCSDRESVKKKNDLAEHLNPFIGHMGRNDNDNFD